MRYSFPSFYAKLGCSQIEIDFFTHSSLKLECSTKMANICNSLLRMNHFPIFIWQLTIWKCTVLSKNLIIYIFSCELLLLAVKVEWTYIQIQSAEKLLILFSMDKYIANISMHALSRPKLNFVCCLTFEFTVSPENFGFSLKIARFDTLSSIISWRFVIVSLLLMRKFSADCTL